MKQKASAVWEELKFPKPEFSPAPFWFLNDDLQKPELHRQLSDFKSKGVDAVVLHPRIGIPKTIPYLSDCYFDRIRYIAVSYTHLDVYKRQVHQLTHLVHL